MRLRGILDHPLEYRCLRVRQGSRLRTFRCRGSASPLRLHLLEDLLQISGADVAFPVLEVAHSCGGFVRGVFEEVSVLLCFCGSVDVVLVEGVARRICM
jgi:hypothetical protein